MMILFSSYVHARNPHYARRPPFLSTSFWILIGKSRHRPSTSRLELTSAQHCLKRVANARGVSSQALAGSVLVRRCRSHETAVSWSMTSCKSPGWTFASSPQKAFRRGFRQSESSEALDSDLGLRSFRWVFQQSESAAPL